MSTQNNNFENFIGLVVFRTGKWSPDCRLCDCIVDNVYETQLACPSLIHVISSLFDLYFDSLTSNESFV